MSSPFDSMIASADAIIQDTFGVEIEIWDGTELIISKAIKTKFKERAQTHSDLSVYGGLTEFIQLPESDLDGVSYTSLEVEYDYTRYKVCDHEIENGFVTLFLVKK